MRKKAALYLATGTHESWVLDRKRRTVTVFYRSGEVRIYNSGDRIPLALFDSEIEVDAIFG